jgi:hypothetical protein
MEQRVRTLSDHIKDLQRMRAELQTLVQKARSLPEARPGTFCHIIENAPRPGSDRTVLPKLSVGADSGS